MRIALGSYLLIHFVLLIPYAGELFSSEGALGDTSLSPFFSGLPSPFWINDRSLVATGVLLSASIASIALIVGWQRKWLAVLLLYVWACLFCRNPLIANPSLAYIGLILLLSVLVPCHETVRYGQSDAKKWYYPSGVYWVAWILLAVGYTFSGFIKLQSPSWIDGTALSHLIENPLARPGFVRDGLRILPENVLKMFTWGALIAEILYVPLSFFRRSRLWIWTVLVIMHLGLLLVVDFLDLTAAMLLIHLFTFDPEWFPAKKKEMQNLFCSMTVIVVCVRTVFSSLWKRIVSNKCSLHPFKEKLRGVAYQNICEMRATFQRLSIIILKMQATKPKFFCVRMRF